MTVDERARACASDCLYCCQSLRWCWLLFRVSPLQRRSDRTPLDHRGHLVSEAHKVRQDPEELLGRKVLAAQRAHRACEGREVSRAASRVQQLTSLGHQSSWTATRSARSE